MLTVAANQSLFDIANQENGSVFTVIALAIANGISITEVLEPGTALSKATSDFTDVDRQRYFNGRILATYQRIPSPLGNDYLLPQLFPLL